MNKPLSLILCILFVWISQAKADSPLADPSQYPFSFGVGFGGVEGLIFETSARINRKINLRIQHAQGLEYKKYERYLDYDYRYYTDGSMTSFIFDFHPFDNGFFLSTGYVLNRFKIKGDSQIPEGSSENIGTLRVLGIPLISASATATDDINLDAKVRWREHGPRLSTGWLFDVDRHFLVRFEIGALFFGDPELILETTGEVDGTDVNQISVVNDERAAQISNFDKEAGKYDVLPIFNFGMYYRF